MSIRWYFERKIACIPDQDWPLITKCVLLGLCFIGFVIMMGAF